MDAIRGDVRKLVNKELNAANKRFRPFASPHEGQNIVREELEEVEQALMPLELHVKKRMWNAVKANKTISQEELQKIREMAVDLAVEAIQVAAMVKKFEHGQHRGWPGGKENRHGTEKKVTPGGCGNRNHNHEPENGGSSKASV